MSKTGVLRKITAAALCFVLVAGLALSFPAQDVSANVTVSAATVRNNNTSVDIYYQFTGTDAFNYIEATLSSYSGTTPSPQRVGSASGMFTFNGLTPNVQYTYYVTAYRSDFQQVGTVASGTFTTNTGGGTVGGNIFGYAKPVFKGDNSASSSQFTITHTGGYLTGSYGFAYSTHSNATSYTQMETWSHQPTYDYTNNAFTGYINTSYMNSSSTYYVYAYYDPTGSNNPSSYVYSAGTQYVPTAGKPIVVTNSVTYSTSTGQISANGTISSTGNTAITDYGFVYSNTNNDPQDNAAGTIRRVVSTSSSLNNQTFSESFYPESLTGSTSTTFYVRAFARNSNGISYGVVQTIHNVTPGTVTVQLGAIEVESGTTASAPVTVSGSGASNVYEYGIVFSDSTQSPNRNSSSVPYVRGETVSVSGNSFTSAPLLMSSLKPLTKYYARAYARTANGVYIYSTHKEFTTPVAVKVDMFTPSGVTHNTAIFSAEITSSGSSSYVSRGFVYSKINNPPTIETGTRVNVAGSSNDFNTTVSIFTPVSRYYVRAFVEYSSGKYVYSDAKEFMTASAAATITVSFRDSNNYEYGSQVIQSEGGVMLTEKSLIPPSGTRLANSRWTHAVDGTQTVIVTIIPPAAATPEPVPAYTPPPQTWQPTPAPAANEQPYMHGIGNYMFGPNNPGTYIEVASMIYNLKANPGQTYYSPYIYSDVNYSNPVIANVVNFVSSNGYMIGNDQNQFLTDKPITRASVAAVISDTLNLMAKYAHEFPFQAQFPDTPPGYWATGFIALGVKEGILGGMYDDSGRLVFKPDNYVTKAELATIFYKMFNRSGMPMGTTPFSDVPGFGEQRHWAYDYIMNAAVSMP